MADKADAAKEKVLDAGAGFPDKDLAEKLPEKDDVQKATKKGMLAETTEEEVAAKVEVVEASPNAEETPSGAALKAVEGISDPVEQGEKYAREKAARRFGQVPAEPETK